MNEEDKKIIEELKLRIVILEAELKLRIVILEAKVRALEAWRDDNDTYKMEQRERG